MEQKLSKLQSLLMVITPIIFLIGFYIYLWKDAKVGGIIIAVAGFLFVSCLFYYFKIKKVNPELANKISSIFYIFIALVMLFLGLGVFIFQRENFKDVMGEVVLAFALLFYGIYKLKAKQSLMVTWNEIPLGMRIILIFLSITIVLGLNDLSANLQQPNLLFGFVIQPPLSLVLSIIFLIIPIVVMFLIYKKVGWKIILVLQSFNFLNGLFGTIKILLTPLPQLFVMLNRPLPNVSPEVLQSVELQSKLIVSIPMFIGLIIALIILIYIYKKKEYFMNN